MAAQDTPARLRREAPTRSEALDERWIEVLAEATERCLADVREAKQDRSRRRKQDVLQAACRVFARDGIAKAKMADIAAEAGIPVSSVYDYFPNKEGLAYEIPIERFGRFFAEFAERAGSLGTMRDRIALFLVLTADFARRNPDWARLLYLEVWPSVLIKQTRVRQAVDDYARVLIEMIRAGERRGEWGREIEPYRTATIMMGSVSQIIITWLLYRRPENLTRATKPLVDQLLRLLDPEIAAAASLPLVGRPKRRSPEA